MDKKVTYHEQTDVENTLRLRDVLKTLPPFCKDFFRAIEPRTTTKTRISYAYDIRIFFQFLLEQRYATALANGSVLNPNWSTLKYGTAEAWEACSVSPPTSRDPEEELRAILGRTLPEGEVARLLRGA